MHPQCHRVDEFFGVDDVSAVEGDPVLVVDERSDVFAVGRMDSRTLEAAGSRSQPTATDEFAPRGERLGMPGRR